MNIIVETSLLVFRKAWIKIAKLDHNIFKQNQFVGEDAGDLLYKRLMDDQPLMVCRFGSTELGCLHRFLNKQERLPWYRKISHYLFNRDLTYPFWWDRVIQNDMAINSGFFPSTPENLNLFCEKMLIDIKQIDILGSWLTIEENVQPFFPESIEYVGLRDLESYYHTRPWTSALRQKKVLVIHPFEDTIKMQYAKRGKLFLNQDVLPDFDLITLKAVQTISNNKAEFSNWFEANDHMCDQIKAIDFDIAIIGCGAYGLSLAAFVKSIGKKAIHMGGATQLLFGIKGNRWDKWTFYQNLYNENWTRVNTIDMPTKKDEGEVTCYL
jgi:hypothetical protein